MKIKRNLMAVLGLFLVIPSSTLAVDSMFGGAPITSLDQWIQLTWGWMASLLIMASTIMLMAAGYIYMASGGDPTRVAKAKQIIVGVFSGLFILLASYFFFTQVLGVPLSMSIWG